MTLREYLFVIFKYRYNGKDKAITRSKLLEVLYTSSILNGYIFGDFTDREMRQAYEDLPICGSSKGLYLPETKGEIDEQVALHMKKVFSYWRKIKVLREYKIESDSVQKNLF